MPAAELTRLDSTRFALYSKKGYDLNFMNYNLNNSDLQIAINLKIIIINFIEISLWINEI